MFFWTAVAAHVAALLLCVCVICGLLENVMWLRRLVDWLKRNDKEGK